MHHCAMLSAEGLAGAVLAFQQGQLQCRVPPDVLEGAALRCGLTLEEEQVEATVSLPMWRSLHYPDNLRPSVAVHVAAVSWLNGGGLHRIARLQSGRLLAVGEAACFLKYFAFTGRLELVDWS